MYEDEDEIASSCALPRSRSETRCLILAAPPAAIGARESPLVDDGAEFCGC